ncbi:MAG: pilus assembly protein TadG [Alphaproteobacteria bacterium]|nr:pilus assembly protein TadG [Alphaproteobacteria bacterium]MDE2493303.1 pilus assembly protein TadG [Alphaproteobacteria bacterium]
MAKRNAICGLMAQAACRARAFARAKRGNVAMIFALSLVPLCLAAGAGLDYARALVVRSNMEQAIDAAGLAVGGTTGLSTAQQQQMAQQYFNANYKVDASYGTPTIVVTPDTSTQTITITASDNMPTTLLNVIGERTLAVSAGTKVVWGQLKLWVALVLDNTGSMTETDSTGTSKITALKNASHQLLAMLQNASATPGDVQVSIVPFTKDVDFGSSYYNSSWLDWTSWDASNGHYQTNCNGNGWAWGGGWGWGGHCNWVANNHNTWNGCVTDRGTATGPSSQNYDVLNTTPTSSDTASYFVPEQYAYCPEALLPLGYDWTALGNEIDGMYANGNTNQTIGLAVGWQTLTQGAPFSPPALPANTQQFIILLSDGLNTEDRWSTSQSYIDSREQMACTNAKAAGVIIYTIFVDLNGTQGNSTALQNCASDASKYFDLTTANQIVSTFNTIGQQITNLHVAQ